jgi:O-antigen ligase
MPAAVASQGYSLRAKLVAGFIVIALILGGGGTPNPITELLLQLIFVLFALAWIWLPSRAGRRDDALIDRWAWLLVVIPLVIPLVQLVPLPPAIWTALPGRDNAIAALSLIGEQSSWRPISLSPSRTLASLLAIVPAVFCFYAVARLDLKERRLVLSAIVALAVAGAWLGALQLIGRGQGFNFYPQHSTGWVTGFQANRNATADVLLIGLMALAGLAAPYFVEEQRRLPLGLTRRTLAILLGGVALFLLVATVMTGSRAGIALIAVAMAGSAVSFSVSRSRSRGSASRTTLILLAAALLVGCIAAFAALSQSTAIARVTERFSDLGNSRGQVWEDSWFALKQYWPVGFGMGGFEPAMFPAEQLAYLDPLVPNRAHNDFLEIGIEAGLLGYAMVVAAALAVFVLAGRAWREPGMRGQIVVGLTTLLLITLHSVVDYPLRSMAVACLSGVAGGLLVKGRTGHLRSREPRRAKDVRGYA